MTALNTWHKEQDMEIFIGALATGAISDSTKNVMYVSRALTEAVLSHIDGKDRLTQLASDYTNHNYHEEPFTISSMDFFLENRVLLDDLLIPANTKAVLHKVQVIQDLLYENGVFECSLEEVESIFFDGDGDGEERQDTLKVYAEIAIHKAMCMVLRAYNIFTGVTAVTDMGQDSDLEWYEQAHAELFIELLAAGKIPNRVGEFKEVPRALILSTLEAATAVDKNGFDSWVESVAFTDYELGDEALDHHHFLDDYDYFYKRNRSMINALVLPASLNTQEAVGEYIHDLMRAYSWSSFIGRKAVGLAFYDSKNKLKPKLNNEDQQLVDDVWALGVTVLSEIAIIHILEAYGVFMEMKLAANKQDARTHAHAHAQTPAFDSAYWTAAQPN